MQTAILRAIAAVCVTGFISTLPLQVRGDDSSSAAVSKFSGTIVRVDDKERTLTARGFWAWSRKTFHVGDSCKVSIEGRNDATLKDLSPGCRVVVQYSSVGGVNVASRVAETFRDYTGHIVAIIVAITPESNSITLKRGHREKTFRLAKDCDVLVNNQKSELGDLKIGQKVTIKYATTDHSGLAHQIKENSLQFVGTVEALDAEARTVKARHFLTDKKFHLAQECPIVIKGEPNGQFSDLRIGDRLVFDYDEVDGVLVANRIAREAEREKPTSGKTAPRGIVHSEP